jgi:hypothetical protein
MDTRLLENSMADNGIEYISDTLAHSITAPFMYVGLIVTSDVTISAITVDSNVTGNTLVGAILPAGSYPFRFSSITFTSGTGMAIKGV